ncbi:MAG: leucine-rich repeat protein [Prevotella sp.]|nr:leucine-rich repeat protein [Prevotella sp.]
MKKFLVSAMVAMSSIASFAYDFEVDGIYYNITSASQMTVEVTYGPKHTNGVDNRGDYDGKNIVVPASVNYNGVQYAVTGIGASAFSHERIGSTGVGTTIIDSHLLSIHLPNSIKYINSYAFCRCVDLTEIKLPVNLQRIGQSAINGVGNILSLTIPASVNTIGNLALPRSVKELIMLPYNPPTGFDSDWGFGADNSDVLVPSRRKYLNSNYRKYNIVEILSPSSYEFVYNGQVPSVEWTNNLSAYTMIVSDVLLEKNAGNHSANVKANFFQSGNLAFSVEFPFEYSINKAKLNVRANNASRVYGDDNPSFNVTYSGFVNGENESEISKIPTISTPAIKTSNVGEYPITVSGGSAPNYEFVYESGILKITKAPLSAKVNDTTKVYGNQNPAFTINYYGLKNGETAPAWTTQPTFQTDATKASGVGNYVIKATNGIPVNYDLGEITTGTLNISPALLTISANDAARQYYSDEPTFSYRCNGFVNGEDESVLSTKPTLSTTATRTSNVGTYEIKVGETSSPNYTISYINGTLTITPRTLTASVGNYERIYNEENPMFEVKYDGFVGNEDESVLSAKATASTMATKTSNVGTYRIDVTGGSAENYKFNYTSGILTINKAEQTISWNQDLNGLKIGDQIELKAVASSVLPITYMMDENNAAELYSTGSKTYLDCKAGGHFLIRAVQDGNNNYYSSPRVSKTISIIGNNPSSDPILTIKQADNGSVGVQVSKGSVYTFTIAPSNGWKIHSVTFNNSDVTSLLTNNNAFTTPAITSNSTLSVVYEQGDDNAVKSLSMSNVKIQATSLGVRVIDANIDDIIRVYTVDGILLNSVKVDEKIVDIPLYNDNVYVIKVGTKTVKLSH